MLSRKAQELYILKAKQKAKHTLSIFLPKEAKLEVAILFPSLCSDLKVATLVRALEIGNKLLALLGVLLINALLKANKEDKSLEEY